MSAKLKANRRNRPDQQTSASDWQRRLSPSLSLIANEIREELHRIIAIERQSCATNPASAAPNETRKLSRKRWS